MMLAASDMHWHDYAEDLLVKKLYKNEHKNGVRLIWDILRGGVW